MSRWECVGALLIPFLGPLALCHSEWSVSKSLWEMQRWVPPTREPPLVPPEPSWFGCIESSRNSAGVHSSDGFLKHFISEYVSRIFQKAFSKMHPREVNITFSKWSLGRGLPPQWIRRMRDAHSRTQRTIWLEIAAVGYLIVGIIRMLEAREIVYFKDSFF